jgi:hypothetical protein
MSHAHFRTIQFALDAASLKRLDSGVLSGHVGALCVLVTVQQQGAKRGGDVRSRRPVARVHIA